MDFGKTEPQHNPLNNLASDFFSQLLLSYKESTIIFWYFKKSEIPTAMWFFFCLEWDRREYIYAFSDWRFWFSRPMAWIRIIFYIFSNLAAEVCLTDCSVLGGLDCLCEVNRKWDTCLTPEAETLLLFHQPLCISKDRNSKGGFGEELWREMTAEVWWGEIKSLFAVRNVSLKAKLPVEGISLVL